MRIGFDGRLAMGSTRGMGRFLRTLIAGREKELIGLCAPGESDADFRLEAGGFQMYPLWEQFSLPALARKLDLQVLICPFNTAPLRLPAGLRLVLVVHDLIFLEDQERGAQDGSLYQRAGRLYRRTVVPRVIERADQIIAVSEHTAQSIQERFRIRPGRIRVIPNTLSTDWYEAPGSAAAREPYVLCVSGEAPHKNLADGIRAFARCNEIGRPGCHALKVVGVSEPFHGHYQELARQLGIGGLVEMLPRVGDEALRQLYREAAVFLFPSLSEGFGIPVLEAMASGTPVVTSQCTSLPEVCGSAALYFNPRSVEDMASALGSALTDPSLRKEMSRLGLEQARKYHPALVAGPIQEFWRDLNEEQ
ncbi:glycosyltransferase family 4 protein [Paludibaculum fermentans]|uniref:Glycosyltransferase family 4 protein n=1 Tax=Paludibaculum fermentans TaxID=1473598 RepID=A0A7S7NKW2_PALFE|nr:glycosyltransferase family 1 protein [Paludibaculum fermentans]QOY85429.1 glycosyltransferase family 4 protein [Paludibaculum fermentans]